MIKPMNKTTKKLDNNVIKALTLVCDSAKEDIDGFVWLTHTADYSRFPGSLRVICVFATDTQLVAAQAQGADITTIEGLGSPDGLHVLQEMFKEHHGLQCGYCTPGMITRAHRLLQENSNPTEEEVRFGISGNLCRCTGYQNIVKAILAAAAKKNEVKESA